MPSKRRQAPTLTSSAKRTHLTTLIALLPTLHHLISATSENCHFQTWLRYQLKCFAPNSEVINYLLYRLKTIMANRLLSVLASYICINRYRNSAVYALLESWQIMEQLSSFFQQLNRATPSITGDTFSNNPPSDDNVTPDADETLSAASDLVRS